MGVSEVVAEKSLVLGTEAAKVDIGTEVFGIACVSLMMSGDEYNGV